MAINFGKSFKNIINFVANSFAQLQLTLRHFKYTLKSNNNHVSDIKKDDYFVNNDVDNTLKYPFQSYNNLDRARYKLENNIEDCIVCNKCANVCPVNCIEIDSIVSPTPIGVTTNGMVKKIYAAKFDIDMAKCCFCGLCTVVCPTKCLTSNSEFDYSSFDFIDFKISFSKMTQDDINKARLLQNIAK
jgi:formate hydrogenlyase subunit 6/NADH:ubiquinone oxidoreductase subunit I